VKNFKVTAEEDFPDVGELDVFGDPENYASAGS
jgi:hypothetical protein